MVPTSTRRRGALAGVGLGVILLLAAAVLFFTPPPGDEVTDNDWTLTVSCASAAFGDDSVQGNAPSERFDGISTDLQMTCLTGRQQHSGAALLLAVLGSTSLIIGATRRS
ncbi:hypothetical protein [Citricoccus sp. NR2]|uniref:hypothetical protein n=1 Tax=Citricoccus sp. NR2 TaxID=3004095 RepID=UPI0022DD0947|nr:hypothetical protein [Citricoccus sp. NR2]WBL19338.1 hypothetical protein O1A05_01100 [Citricoccus sp. NR2]